MLLKKTICILISLTTAFLSFAQDYKTNPGYRFSKTEIHEILLDKSKQQKTKAIVAVSSGPVMVALGIYITHKNGLTVVNSGGGWISVENSPGATVGALISVAGVMATLSSVPYFLSAAKLKKKAKLVLSDQSTSFLKSRISVPSVSIQFCL